MRCLKNEIFFIVSHFGWRQTAETSDCAKPLILPKHLPLYLRIKRLAYSPVENDLRVMIILRRQHTPR